MYILLMKDENGIRRYQFMKIKRWRKTDFRAGILTVLTKARFDFCVSCSTVE